MRDKEGRPYLVTKEADEDRPKLLARLAELVALQDLGPLCEVTNVYVSRCEHCGAKPLNASTNG